MVVQVGKLLSPFVPSAYDNNIKNTLLGTSRRYKVQNLQKLKKFTSLQKNLAELSELINFLIIQLLILYSLVWLQD